MSQPWEDVLTAVERHPRTIKAFLTPEVIESSMQLVESECGYEFPEIYRSWLRRFDVAEIGGNFIFGVGGEGNLEDQQLNLRNGWVNIGNDGCGNYFILVLSKEFALDEPVIFLDAYKEPYEAYIVASDFAMFVRRCLKDDVDDVEYLPYWHGDRDAVLMFDPDLERAKNIQFPWED